jgi:hypothetical protein
MGGRRKIMIDKPRKIKEWRCDEKMSKIDFISEPTVNNLQGFIGKESRKRFLIGEGDNCIRMDFRDGVYFGLNLTMAYGAGIDFKSVPAPTSCTVALSNGGGSVTAGIHSYKITFKTYNLGVYGETELGAVSNSVTNDGTHKTNLLTNIPISGLFTVISRKIYRNTAGTGLYYYLDEITDNSVTTYTDILDDGSLGTAYANWLPNTTGGGLSFDGSSVLRFTRYNVGVGIDTLTDNTFGNFNVAVGYDALNSNTTGEGNTMVGSQTSSSSTEAKENVGMGRYSLDSLTLGNGNVAIGNYSGGGLTTGDYNVAVGYGALMNDSNPVTGDGNVAIGYGALNECSQTCAFNVCLGYNAGYDFAGSNTLIIENSDNITTPLILGDFSGDSLKFHGCTGSPHQNKTLGIGATTMAITRDVVIVTGDAGGNTLATITGGVDGQVLKLIFVDALVVITDDDTHAANSCDLSAAFTGADDKTLTLVYDGTSWYELSRSIN